MRTAKMPLVFCLAFALLFFCSSAALSETDLSADIRNASDYCITGTISENKIYVLGTINLYTWQPGETGLTVTPLITPPARPLSVFMHDGNLLLLANNAGWDEAPELILFNADITEGKLASFTEKARLQTDMLTGGQDESISILSALFSGNRLYLTVRYSNQDNQLLACDTDSGKTEVIKHANIGTHLFAADDNSILVECLDQENGKAWYELYNTVSCTFSAHGGTFSFDRLTGGLAGAAWDAANNRLYYQENGFLKAAKGVDPGSAETLTSLIRPCTSADNPAGITGGHYYVYLTHNGAVAVDLNDCRERTVKFKVTTNTYSDAALDALADMQAKHPEVMPILDRNNYSDDDLISRLAQELNDIDVFIVQSGTLPADLLYIRDVIPELTNTNVIEAVSKMYPVFKDAVTHGDRVIGLPIAASGSTVGFNRELLDLLDKPGAELPTSFADLIERLEELDLKTGEHEHYSIFPLHMSERAIRDDLIFNILNIYHKDYAEDTSIGYHTPELIEALEKAVNLDLEKMGIGNGESTDIELYSVLPLINSASPVECAKYSLFSEPLALTVIPDSEAGLPIDITVAFINPFSEHKELAQEYIAAILDHISDTARYSLSDEYNEPIPDQEIMDEIAKTQSQRDILAQKLETATGIDKEELTDKLEFIDDSLELLNSIVWKLDKESIERYRANAGRLFVRGYNYATSGDTENLRQRLIDGIITPDEFTRELDKQLEMMKKEGL